MDAGLHDVSDLLEGFWRERRGSNPQFRYLLTFKFVVCVMRSSRVRKPLPVICICRSAIGNGRKIASLGKLYHRIESVLLKTDSDYRTVDHLAQNSQKNCETGIAFVSAIWFNHSRG